MKMQQIYPRIKTLLPIIGIGVFIYIIFSIGIQNINEAIGEINLLFFILSFLIFFPRIIISTYKWKMISTEQGINIRLISLLKFNIIGIFYGTVTPLWIGDYIRIPYLQEETGERFGKCASTVLIDQAVELAALFILALGGGIILIRQVPMVFLALFVLFIIFFISALMLKEKERSRRLCLFIYRFFIPKKLKGLVEKEFHSFYSHIPQLRFLFVPLLLEIGSYILFFTQIYILTLSFSVLIPYTSFILIYPIASLISLFPISISGLGTREGALIHLFSFYGVSSDITVAISLGGYIVTLLLPSFIGGILSITMRKKKHITTSLPKKSD